MAITVEFEGWVNEVKPTEWGAYVTVAHQQRAKNETTGEWETVGKDYLDVSVKRDLLPAIEGAKVVRVVGTLKAGAFIKRDGTAGASLKVNAREISPVERGTAPTSPAAPVAASASDWASFGATPILGDDPF